MSKKGYRVDCHTHLWRYPGELTDELARETFIMRNKEVDLDITPDMHMAAVAEVDCAIVFGLRAPQMIIAHLGHPWEIERRC